VKGALVNHVLVFRTTLLTVCQSTGAVALQLNRNLNTSCMSMSNTPSFIPCHTSRKLWLTGLCNEKLSAYLKVHLASNKKRMNKQGEPKNKKKNVEVA